MPSAEEQALALSQRADGSVDLERFQAEYQQALAERQERLRWHARAAFRALDGWRRVETEEDWAQMVRQADEDLGTGTFLLDRLGATRYLDPPLMAALLALRGHLIEEHGATTAAELMIIDSAVLSYYHTIRVNGWVGDLAQVLENEFFGTEPPTPKLKARWGADSVRGLKVEEIVGQLVDKLMPLIDRSNRMLLRNLKALKAMREGPIPSVSIGRVGQVNVADRQLNVAADAERGQTAEEPAGEIARTGDAALRPGGDNPRRQRSRRSDRRGRQARS